MLENIKSGQRGRQILEMLYKEGPLTSSGLQKLITPKMASRRMRDALWRLFKRKLIMPRSNKNSLNAAHYYQLRQTLPKRKLIGAILKVDPEKLHQEHFRSQDLEHSECCALWSQKLKHLFPTATVLREHEYAGNLEATPKLHSLKNDRELRPDLLLLIPSTDSRSIISVGIEIERTVKTHARLFRKLKKLASQCPFDGVLYFCSTESIVDALRTIYHSRVKSGAHRINHYGNNFLMFANSEINSENTAVQTFNTERKCISLAHWIHFLSKTELLKRRDTLFESSAMRG